VRQFADLLKLPGLALVITAQLLARFPAGMYSLGILMHVEHSQGNYTSAGLVLAAFSIGTAVAGPIVSRQLSRFGTMPVLLVTLILAVSSVVILAVVPLSLPAMMILGALGGAATPPIIPAVRSLYPQLVPQNQLTRLFSLDAALQEIIWVIGPVAITLLVTLLGSSTALLIVATIQVVGGLIFTFAPHVRRLRIPATSSGFGKVLRNSSVVLMFVTSMFLIGGFAAVEAAIVASFGEGSLNAGLVLGICSIGSLLGGLISGQRPLTRWSMALRLVVVTAGFGIAAATSGFWALSIALFIAGLGCAPALAAVSSVIAGSVDFSDTAEAYGWIGTGQLLGASVGSALAGVAIDHAGGQGGLLVSFGIVAVAAVIAALFRRAQPDLSSPVEIIEAH